MYAWGFKKSKFCISHHRRTVAATTIPTRNRKESQASTPHSHMHNEDGCCIDSFDYYKLVHGKWANISPSKWYLFVVFVVTAIDDCHSGGMGSEISTRSGGKHLTRPSPSPHSHRFCLLSSSLNGSNYHLYFI